MSHINPSEIPHEDIVQSEFRRPADLLSSPLPTQPEPDPSVVMDIDNSVAIDVVRGLLATDFTETRAQWLHLAASVLTDMRIGLRQTLITNPLDKLKGLLHNEQLSLNSVNLTLVALQGFFSDCQGNPDDWSMCFRCVTECHMPCTDKDWEAHTLTCGHIIQAARDTIVNEGVRRTNQEIDDFLANRRALAFDTVINQLVSEHAPSFDHLLGDPRLVEWARRLHESMSHYYQETLTAESTTALHPNIRECLDSHRQEAIDTAKADAKEKARQVHYATLQNLQAAAMEEAQRDFENWKTSTLIPEFQAKEAAARESAVSDLTAYKHILTIKSEERKENARLQAIKDVTPPTKSELRIAHRKERKPNPTKGSRSVSRAASPAPSSSQKALDKTPTKADFQVSRTTLSTSTSEPLPLYGAESAKASAGPSVVGTSCVQTSRVPGDLRTPPFTADTPLSGPPDVLMDGTAGQVHPVQPSRTTAPPVSTEMATYTTTSDLAQKAGLVEHYQSATPSLTPPVEDAEARMMRMIQLAVGQAIQPIQSSLSDLRARIDNVETAQATLDGWGAEDPDNGPPIGADYQQDYILNCRDSDEDMSEPDHTPDDQSNEIHPFFYRAYAHLMDILIEKEYDITKDQEAGVVMMADLWFPFCIDHRLPSSLPPAQKVGNLFIELSRVDFRARTYKEQLHRSIDNDITSRVVYPDDRTDRFPAFREPAPHLVPDPFTKFVDLDLPDNEGRQQSTPPITALGDRASAPIELSSSDEAPVRGMGKSPLRGTDAQGGWSVVGGKKGRSYATIAAKPTSTDKPLTASDLLPPSFAQAAAGFITKAQLESMTKEQVVYNYNLRFEPKILVRRGTKAGFVAAYLDKASRAPVAPKPPQAPPPITKTDYTLIRDPTTFSAGLAGTRGDAAAIVRAIQARIRAAGTAQPAQLIGGRWSTQSPMNFILTFNGNPAHDDVLRLRSVFLAVLGPHYALAPARGYIRVILNSVPTLFDEGRSLPSPEMLKKELAQNDALKGLIILRDPYWLTARNAGARHGSISFSFIDEDGSRLKDMIRNPPFLFGNRTTKVRKFVSRPLISQCERCWALGHDSTRCRRPPATLVCSLCGGAHKDEEHPKRCPNVSKHTDIHCTCPPTCINCRRARKPAGGHTATSTLCPLRSNFRAPQSSQSDSPDEGRIVRPSAPADGGKARVDNDAADMTVSPTPPQ